MKNNSRIVELIEVNLKEMNYSFELDEEKGIFDFSIKIPGPLRDLRYIILVREEAFCVYAISPLWAEADDEDQIKRMMEFFHRANYGLINGNFEFDCEDGEIKFKMSEYFGKTLPTREMIQKAIIFPATMILKYGKAMIEVMFGLKDAREAIEKCERDAKKLINLILRIMEDGDEGTTEDPEAESFFDEIFGDDDEEPKE